MSLRNGLDSMNTIIEKSVDGMIIVDRDGRVMFMNPASERILDREADDLLGCIIGIPIMIGESIEITINRRDGISAVAEARLAEIYWEDKDVFLISLRDITELKQMQLEIQQKNLELEDRIAARTHELNRANQQLSQKQEELQTYILKLKQKAEDLKTNQKKIESQNQELRDAHMLIQEKAQALEQSNNYKSEFLANMSHELRTPLNSLMIYAQLLAENTSGNLNDKQVKFAKDIRFSGSELLSLIDDILDLSKIEAGRVELVLEKIEFPDIKEYLKLVFEPLVVDKGLVFEILMDSNLPNYIVTDRQRLYQILKNLMSNAIKFTHQGSITVSCSVPDKRAWGSDNKKPVEDIAISVRDTGIGIPKEKQKIIFESFHQADGSTSRNFGGTGLGLSISRELANLMNARMRLQSTEGQGSTFTLYLPGTIETGSDKSRDKEQSATPDILYNVTCVNDEPVKHVAVDRSPSDFTPDTIRKKTRQLDVIEKKEKSSNSFPTALSQSDKSHSSDQLTPRQKLFFKNKRILLVDDDMRNVFALLGILENNGFVVETASNGQIALDIIRNDSEFDAILMDMMMPVVDGFEAIRTIRKIDAVKEIPIISVTARAMLGEREKCLSAGANDYVSKPIDINKLFSCLESWLK